MPTHEQVIAGILKMPRVPGPREQTSIALALEIVRAAKVVLPLMELATTEQTAANERLDKLLAQWEERT